MKKNYLKRLCIASMACVAFPGFSAQTILTAGESEGEFNSNWIQIHDDDAPAWEWSAGTKNHLRVHPQYNYASSSRGNGQGIFMAEGIEMSAGEIYNLQALVSTSDYNDDQAFRFAYTTDGITYTDIATTDQTVWNDRNAADYVYKTKPNDTSYVAFTVPADGTYHLGIYSRGGNNKATSYLVLAELRYEKKVDFPGKVTGMSVTSEAGPGLEATVNWTWPTKSDANATLSACNALLYRSLESSFKPTESVLVADITDGVPGEKSSYTDNTVTEPGKYYYFLQTYYGDGINPQAQYAQSKWLGEDVKCLNIVQNTATLASEGDGFKITFVKRIEGYNGGWIDSELAFIKITRQKNNEEPVVVTDDYQGESPYIDAEVDGPGSYTYRLYVTYKESESGECKLGPVFGGGAETLPYSEDFSDSNSLNNYTVISSNTQYKWNRNYLGYLQYNTSSYSKTKSSALTPPVKLEAGKTYRVACKTWAEEEEIDDDWGYGSYYEVVPKDLYLTAGKLATFEGQQQLAKINVNKASDEKMTAEAFFTPEESGNYYFGFQAEFANAYKVYVDDVEIAESELLPADVTDFAVAAGADGAKEAVISFTIPAKSNGGLDLTTLSYVSVTRIAEGEGEEAVEVKRIEGDECVPGTAVEFTDEVPVENYYTYTVVAALEDKLSNPVSSQKMWIGYDYPKNISSFSLSLDSDETGAAVVKWSPLSGSSITQHGGYADVENLKYKIYRIVGGDYNGECDFVGYATESPYVDKAVADMDWNRYRYGVSVLNGELESSIVVSNNTKVLGDAIELPLITDFATENTTASWDSRGFLTDEGKHSCYNKGEYGDSEFYTILPPFYATAEKPVVDLTMTLSRGNMAYDEVLHVYAVRVGDVKSTVEDPEEENSQVPEARMREEAVSGPAAAVVVTASEDEPEEQVHHIQLPSAGKYRIKIQLASENNKSVNIHTLSLNHNTSVGVENLYATSEMRYDSLQKKVILGADVVKAEVYTIGGMLVKSVENSSVVDMNRMEAGVYVVKAVTASENVTTLKLVK